MARSWKLAAGSPKLEARSWLLVLSVLGLTLACGGLTTETPSDPVSSATPVTPTLAAVQPSPSATSALIPLPSATPAPALPDLVPHAAVSMRGYDGDCITAYAPLDSEVCVENVGQEGAGPFVMWAGDGGEQGIWPVAGLAAGQTACFSVTTNLSGAPVTADAGGTVAESREDNNTWWVVEPTPPAICRAGDVAPPTVPVTPTESFTTTLAIRRFDVDVVDLADGGKRITFAWRVTGANEVRLFSGTADRFGWWRSVPVSGTLTEDFAGTQFRDPEMTLIGYGAGGDQVAQSVVVAWPCAYDYFFAAEARFDPVPRACPQMAAQVIDAKEQVFEYGRMIWLREVRGENDAIIAADVILVLFDDAAVHVTFDSTWEEGMPVYDPAFTPPEGKFQPVREFGKLWRDNLDVRERVGWGLSSSRAFTAIWQPASGEVAYLRLADRETVVRFEGWWQGVWAEQ